MKRRIHRAFNSSSAARAQMASKGDNKCACGKWCGRFTKCLDCFEKEKVEKATNSQLTSEVEKKERS